MTTQQAINAIIATSTYVRMSVTEFIQFCLSLRNGSFTFGRITLLVEEEMNKTGNPFYGRVQKLSSFNVGLQGGYEAMVERMRERCGVAEVEQFIALPGWFVPMNGKSSCAVGTHNINTQQVYLSVYPNNSHTTEVTYFIDGVEATAFQLEQLKPFLKQGSKGSKRQGLPEDKQIIIRRPKIENVVLFHADGMKIQIVK